MKLLFLFIYFILFNFIYCKIVNNEFVEIYGVSHGNDLYFNNADSIPIKILNSKGFDIEKNMAKISYEYNEVNYEASLLSYELLPKTQTMSSDDKYSVGFTPIKIGVYRGRNYRNNRRDCAASIACINRYITYVNYGLRLWTANQMYIDTEDLYISSDCLEIDNTLYPSANLVNLNKALTEAAVKLDGDKGKGPYASKWFITDDFTGGWLGMAATGSASIISKKNSNYWMFVKYNPDPPEDITLQRLFTIIHEFTHNIGCGHADIVTSDVSGGFINWVSPDGNSDVASWMGSGDAWDNPPTVSHYQSILTTTSKGYEPFYFQTVKEGISTYRLFAWDHPYSRYVKGVTESFYSENDTIGGIPAYHNVLGLTIPITLEICSKLNPLANEANILLEYRIKEDGLEGAKSSGVRITYGKSNVKGFYNTLSERLDANYENINGWEDSEIPIGIDYVPNDVDIGTLIIRVTGIHRTIITNKTRMILETQQRDYNEAPYVELTVTYKPRQRYIKPTTIPEFPSFTTSPSFFNCQISDNNSVYMCYRTSTQSGWIYMNEESRRINIPRTYNYSNGWYNYRLGVRSYNGKDFLQFKQCYGDTSFKCVNININYVSYSGTLIAFSNVIITQTQNGINQDLGTKVFIYLSDVTIPTGGNAYVTDLFDTHYEINSYNNILYSILPKLEVDGIFEGGIVIKNSEGTITCYKEFTLYNNENSNRVALQGKNGKYIATPASLYGKYTTTSMFGKRVLDINSWFIYPVLNLQIDEYVFIDFYGIIPSDLIMSFEVDTGIFEKDLSDFFGLENITLKLSCLEINEISKSDCQIYKFKFNKEITLLNIRPVYTSAIGDQLSAVDAFNGQYTIGESVYKLQRGSSTNSYIFNPVNVNINGITVDLPTSTSSQEIQDIIRTDPPITIPTTTIQPTNPLTFIPTEIPIITPTKSPNKSNSTILIISIVGGIILLLIILIIYCYIMKERRRTSSGSKDLDDIYKKKSKSGKNLKHGIRVGGKYNRGESVDI